MKISNIKRVAHENRRNTLDLIYFINPIYYISRIVGLSLYSLKQKPNGEIIGTKLKIIDIIWFITILVIYFFLFFVSWTKIKLSVDFSYALFLGIYIFLLLGLTSGIVSVILNMLYRNYHVDLSIQIKTIDAEVILQKLFFFRLDDIRPCEMKKIYFASSYYGLCVSYSILGFFFLILVT